VADPGGAGDGLWPGDPYLPIIDLLKEYFLLEARDDRPTVTEKVTSKLLRCDDTLKFTVPAFLALFDVPAEDPQWQAIEATQRRQRILDAIKRLLLWESQRQPLLLAIENVHWIDTETQAALDLLIESLPAARLLCLTTYRPEYRHAWGSKTSYTQLRLDPLPAPAFTHSSMHYWTTTPPSIPSSSACASEPRATLSSWKKASECWWKRRS
jgi:predicted ATPase